jgi:hypothetical protein
MHHVHVRRHQIAGWFNGRARGVHPQRGSEPPAGRVRRRPRANARTPANMAVPSPGELDRAPAARQLHAPRSQLVTVAPTVTA